jgi:predicted PurR-regulated permease PerM
MEGMRMDYEEGRLRQLRFFHNGVMLAASVGLICGVVMWALGVPSGWVIALTSVGLIVFSYTQRRRVRRLLEKHNAGKPNGRV